MFLEENPQVKFKTTRTKASLVAVTGPRAWSVQCGGAEGIHRVVTHYGGLNPLPQTLAEMREPAIMTDSRGNESEDPFF